jgi:hypothetical protein
MYCVRCGVENIENSSRCIRCGNDLLNLERYHPPKLKEETKDKINKTNWWWPDVSTVELAEEATKRGMWAAVVVSVLIAIIATIAASTGEIRVGNNSINAWVFADSAIFAAVAFGLYKRSRFAAVAGLVCFLIEKIDQIASNAVNTGSMFSAIVILLCFVGAVRGTYALHRMKSSTNA